MLSELIVLFCNRPHWQTGPTVVVEPYSTTTTEVQAVDSAVAAVSRTTPIVASRAHLVEFAGEVVASTHGWQEKGVTRGFIRKLFAVYTVLSCPYVCYFGTLHKGIYLCNGRYSPPLWAGVVGRCPCVCT